MNLNFQACSLGFSSLLAIGGVAKGALSQSGGLAAVCVGWATAQGGAGACAALLTFFVTSSALTRVGKRRKQRIEENYQPHGGRTAVQVFANGATGSLFAVACAAELGGGFDWRLAVVAHYAACNGDTWASELGTAIAGAKPRLVLPPFRVVPAGTNGGMTLVGTIASALGGAVVGGAYALAGDDGRSFGSLVAFGAAAGAFGSLVDSILGATVQLSNWHTKKERVVEYSDAHTRHIAGRDWLDNHQVNFVAALVTALLFAKIKMQ
eukprot:TRINITY_DN6200_c0_g1_i1.p1 TRINITY_DN6200_c0_g1~~TRINITY_DN6200_c0_g1_i1.p1  ORF type:complete len:280 (+),score=81.24 TRINITY_DN6200_c0_g1_i1:43-840(+)